MLLSASLFRARLRYLGFAVSAGQARLWRGLVKRLHMRALGIGRLAGSLRRRGCRAHGATAIGRLSMGARHGGNG